LSAAQLGRWFVVMPNLAFKDGLQRHAALLVIATGIKRRFRFG
jgi:hypothetical protein